MFKKIKIFSIFFLLGIPVITNAQDNYFSGGQNGEVATCPEVDAYGGDICHPYVETGDNGKKTVYCLDPCADDPNFKKIGKSDENCISHKDGCTDGVARYECVNGKVKCVKHSDPVCPECISSEHYIDIIFGKTCEQGKAEGDPDGKRCTYPKGTWKCINGEAVCKAPAPVCPDCYKHPDFNKINASCSITINYPCNKTNWGKYVCINDEVVCNAEEPKCYRSCKDVKAPKQGKLKYKDYENTDLSSMFINANNSKLNDGSEIGYICVRTTAEKFEYFSKDEKEANDVLNVGMFGWDEDDYNDEPVFKKWITAAITGKAVAESWIDDNGVKQTWADDRTILKTNRETAYNAYTKESACYVCGSIRLGGCFSPETKITLADGSVKQAKDINAGDELLNPLTKKGVIVDKVIEGPEDVGMVSIKTVNSTLKVSQEHPMLTSKGLVQAKDLKAGDTIFNGDNQELEVASVEILPVEEGQYVINFIVKGDGDIKDYKNRMLLSEGVVTGDLTTQIELKLSK